MRVVAGIAGGRRLGVPARSDLRPTSERVREAVLAILGSLGAVEGAAVLDLFAGTGAMGIETLSRGALSATFVDDDPAAVAAIRANLTATGLGGPAAEVVRADALRFVADASSAGRRWDIVLADPPYGFPGWPELVAALPAPLVVLEADNAIEVPEGWVVVRSRRYGGSVVTVARRPEPPERPA